MAEREYFVLSIAHTQRRSPCIILWVHDDSGYRGRMAAAGRYTESQIKARIGYYNDGENTIAVPSDVLEPLSHPVPDGWFDENGGRWLRNNRATWQAAIKHHEGEAFLPVSLYKAMIAAAPAPGGDGGHQS